MNEGGGKNGGGVEEKGENKVGQGMLLVQIYLFQRTSASLSCFEIAFCYYTGNPYLFSFQAYSPTSFDKSFASQEVEKHQVEFALWDTSGEGSEPFSIFACRYLGISHLFFLAYKKAGWKIHRTRYGAAEGGVGQ